ncbi:hypothetical protein BGZ68_005050, partial [Mortierella alpina]
MSDSTSTITINVKASNENKYEITISPAATVLEFKTKISEKCDLPAERIRLIYSGRVLKDADTLESYKVQEGHTIHMVRGAAPAGTTATATTTTTTPAATAATTTPAASTAPTSTAATTTPAAATNSAA